jgi:hypothetical protein
MNRIPHTIVSITGCLAPSLVAQNIQPPDESGGTQIAWASEAFATNLMADGITTFEGSGEVIRFEIGTFSPGFDPRTATPEQWLTHWVILQGTDYDLVDQQFIQTATLFDNAPPFGVGGPIFIWGYTSKDLSQEAEWLIVTADSWTWPSVDAPLPTTVSMSDASDAGVLIGSVNGSGYHMQLQIIPEPSTFAVFWLGTALFVARRRR